MLLLQTAGSGKRKRAAAAGSAAGGEESGQSGGLSDEAESSEEGTSGVKPKPASAKKRANPRKPSHPMRSAIDEGSTGSDAKKVRNICTVTLQLCYDNALRKVCSVAVCRLLCSHTPGSRCAASLHGAASSL